MTLYLFHLLFYFLLFLLMCGILCKHVCANISGEPSPLSEDIVTIFNKDGNGNVQKLHNSNLEDTVITAKEYYSPVLISAGNIMVALTGVNEKNSNDDKCITVLANYTDTKDEKKWKENVVKSANWKQTSGIQKDFTSTSDTTAVKGFIAAANENKIYVLLVYCNNNKGIAASSELTCIFEIIFGTVTDDDDNQGKKISLDKSKLPLTTTTHKFTAEPANTLEGSYFISGNAFVTKEKNIIFSVKTKITNDKIIFLFLVLKTNESKLEISQITDISEKCHPYIFLWNNKIIKLTTDCNGGDGAKIDELTDTNGKWSKIQDKFFCLINFLNDKKDFITEIIDGKYFMFFTQNIEPLPSSGGKSNKYLWISDGTRAKNIGEITIDSKCSTPNNFFIIKGELFLLIQNCGDENKVESIELKHLKEHTGKMKDVLLAWDSEKNKISQLCGDSVPYKVYCHTDGLVGFLFNDLDKDTKDWKDEYYYKNATVTEGKGATDGITFKGKNAGARWPVSKEKENQPHNFFDPGFTFVATVTVREVPGNNHNLILGVEFAENERTINLLCSNEKKWVMHKGKDKTKLEPTNENCENGDTYQLALIFEQKNKLTLYVNGILAKTVQIEKTENVLNFYFGADNKQTNDETHVIIENVLLYNYPFNKNGINNLKVIKKSTPTDVEVDNKENSMAGQQSNNGNPQITEEAASGGSEGELTPDTVTEEVVPSSTQQRESAVCNNVNVVMCSVLYLMLLLCVVTKYRF